MVNDLFLRRDEFGKQHAELLRNPLAWLLVANPVWGRHETLNRIALFDTLQALRFYVKASKLPASVQTADGIRRTFRPDSLLYEYNEPHPGEHEVPALPWMVDLESLSINPPPPEGAVPELTLLDKPQYGVDYDVGFGGAKTNMDGVTPTQPA